MQEGSSRGFLLTSRDRFVVPDFIVNLPIMPSAVTADILQRNAGNDEYQTDNNTGSKDKGVLKYSHGYLHDQACPPGNSFCKKFVKVELIHQQSVKKLLS
jgi:hypothetical protein